MSGNRSDFTKAERRQFRKLKSTAWERELGAELAKLEQRFAEWRAGEIGPHDLNDSVHRFHDGASRDLWKSYTQADEVYAVASAVLGGFLEEADVPESARDAFSQTMRLMRASCESDPQEED